MALLKFHTQRTDTRTQEQRRKALEFGQTGEQMAARFLTDLGYIILEHNYRRGHLEIDLIAESKKEVVFAEVKARTTTFGDKTPEEYVDEDKKRRMIAAGNAYVKLKKLQKTLRFDVIGILVDPQTQEITYRGHWENAFQPTTHSIGSGSYNGAWKWTHRNKTIGRKR